MELRDIKKSFFGFSRNSVFEYITELNVACSQKVEEIKDEKAAALAELNRKNEELNNSNAALQAEYDELKKQLEEKDKLLEELKQQNAELAAGAGKQKTVEAEVAEILTEAKRFSDTLREKAIRENEAFRLQNRRINDAERQRLAEYGKEISQIKTVINAVLAETESKLENAESKIADLQKTADE